MSRPTQTMLRRDMLILAAADLSNGHASQAIVIDLLVLACWRLFPEAFRMKHTGDSVNMPDSHAVKTCLHEGSGPLRLKSGPLLEHAGTGRVRLTAAGRKRVAELGRTA